MLLLTCMPPDRKNKTRCISVGINAGAKSGTLMLDHGVHAILMLKIRKAENPGKRSVPTVMIKIN